MRSGRGSGSATPWLWLLPGVASLALFGWLLTIVDVPAAGRAYAAYGGVYIGASQLWLWIIEGVRPDRWDVLGAVICLAGVGVILTPEHRVRSMQQAHFVAINLGMTILLHLRQRTIQCLMCQSERRRPILF